MQGNDNAGPGDRQGLIARAFDEMVSGADGDVIQAAHALTRWSLRLLDVDGAGVMMVDDGGVLRSLLVSSEAVRVLEAAELHHDRGPCVESHRRVQSVIHADFDVPDARWPEFGPLARAGGMRAAHAIPVRSERAAIGVLNLFRASTGGLTDADAALAQSLADAAGAAVSPRRSPARTVRRAEDLAAMVADAAVVERATGMLAVRLRVDVELAAAVLRRVAKDHGRAVSEVADTVVTGRDSIALPLSIEAVRPPRPAATGSD